MARLLNEEHYFTNSYFGVNTRDSEERKEQCLLGPGAGPDGAMAPTSIFGPGSKWGHGLII